MKETLVVNLFGGPGTGKSTMMAGIFAKLKSLGYDVFRICKRISLGESIRNF